MKYYIGAFLFVVGLFIGLSCSSSTSADTEDEFESYTIGSFEMVSPDTAEWIGTATNKQPVSISSNDSVVISEPGDQHLTIERTDRGVDAQITFTDSTISAADSIGHDGIEYDIYRKEVVVWGGIGSTLTDYMEIRLSGDYLCPPDSVDVENLGVTLSKDSTLYKHYTIEINGFTDVMDSMFCD